MSQVQFDSLNWKSALEKSKLSGKPIFVHAYTVWCEPCEEMYEYVFSDLEVGNFFNKNFINLQIDLEKNEYADFTEKYDINMYPDFLFFNQYGEVVHRGCGTMDASDLLYLGESALNNEENLMFYKKKYERGDRSTETVMNYFSLLELSCLDVEGVASSYLSSLKLEELTKETAWAVFAFYNWDIYSREFQYLLNNQKKFQDAIDAKAVQAKIYDTFLGQYQEVYEAEELHDFGMRSLLHTIRDVDFLGADTLKIMMQLHYASYTEDWDGYVAYAQDYVELMREVSVEELSELAWQFYLSVEDRNHLEVALKWAKSAVEQAPDPYFIDTYASLQYKLGNNKKAVELERKALELAEKLYEDTEHFEDQLEKFLKK